jgi:CDGSH-type Zn-finger protein
MRRRPNEIPAATVVPYPDGPLILRGDFELSDVDGTPIERSGASVALCRCGRSAVKPFCDSSHKRAVSASSRRTDAAEATARKGRLA